MPKNKIQFQEGYSLISFISEYGTEKQCQDALFSLRWPHGFECPDCGHSKYVLISTRNLYQCKRCRYQASLISRSIFAFTKLPLTKWFLGIYLITQSKQSISSLHLARTIGVSFNSAFSMKHKILQVMKERDDSQPLSNFCVQLDDAYWGGKKRDGVRGRGATGKTPFLAAVSLNEEGHPIAMRFSAVKSFTQAEVMEWIQKHIVPGRIIVTDGLSCFNSLNNSEYSHIKITTGGGPDSVKIPDFKWVNTVIANVKTSIRGIYHSVSRKHFPRYLAEFCYRFNRRFQLKNLMPRFLYVALRTPPMPQRLLKLAEAPW